MDVKRVQVWLERTKEWKSDQSGEQNDGSGHRSELRVFLTDLHRQLVEWVRQIKSLFHLGLFLVLVQDVVVCYKL